MSTELEHLAKGLDMVRKINAKVDALLRPFEHELSIMGYTPAMQAVMWHAVMLGAKERMEKADE